jgi:hypothetical protein
VVLALALKVKSWVLALALNVKSLLTSLLTPIKIAYWGQKCMFYNFDGIVGQHRPSLAWLRNYARFHIWPSMIFVSDDWLAFLNASAAIQIKKNWGKTDSKFQWKGQTKLLVSAPSEVHMYNRIVFCFLSWPVYTYICYLNILRHYIDAADGVTAPKPNCLRIMWSGTYTASTLKLDQELYRGLHIRGHLHTARQYGRRNWYLIRILNIKNSDRLIPLRIRILDINM